MAYTDGPFVVAKYQSKWLVVSLPDEQHRHGLVVAEAPTEYLAGRCLRGLDEPQSITTEPGHQADNKGAQQQ